MSEANNIHYTEKALKLKYENLTDAEKLRILWEALGMAKQYGTLSRWDCVFMSMGYHYTNAVVDGETLWKESR